MLTVYPSRYAIMANFKRGRDKKKRKSRMLRNAAIAAGGLAGLAGAGYGTYRLAKAGKLGARAQGMAERAGLRANSIKAGLEGRMKGYKTGSSSDLPARAKTVMNEDYVYGPTRPYSMRNPQSAAQDIDPFQTMGGREIWKRRNK